MEVYVSKREKHYTVDSFHRRSYARAHGQNNYVSNLVTDALAFLRMIE